jgi:SAM-dependent methyltransferase
MSRKSRIILIVILIALAVGALVFLNEKSKGASASAANLTQERPRPKEITIRNITRDVVTYTLVPYESEEKPIEKKLPVGAIDRVPASRTMLITYKSYGRDVSYSLYPGKPYSFRYDSAGQIDIWAGSHGREDAEDLAPFVPTPPEVVAKMLEMTKTDKDAIVYDVGCGDGRIVITAAQKYGAHGVGIDIDPERIKECRVNARIAGVEKLVTFLQEDATKTDLSKATIVTLYLLPESNELLRPKFDKDLRPGTLVVSHNYVVPGWEHKEVASATVADSEGTEHSIFLYKK